MLSSFEKQKNKNEASKPTHHPVLVKEVIEILKPTKNKNFIDCTIGEGGHSFAILQKNKPKGRVLGIEWDKEIYRKLKLRIEKVPNSCSKRLILVNDSYINLKKIIEKLDFGPIDGILFDLGMSSWHLERSSRGFTFLKDEPLDMRYHSKVKSQRLKVKNGLTAEKIVNEYSQEELTKILKEYGEERFARKIAKKITEERKKEPIKTTFQLVEIIKEAIPKRYYRQRIHFATRTFQALRIAVNKELENLKKALPQAIEVLRKGGIIVVISFHSLEDRIVKNFFKNLSLKSIVEIITKKPIRPSEKEIKSNPRCRSAKLRAAKKI